MYKRQADIISCMSEITQEQLQNAQEFVAGLVMDGHRQYLPLFARLERELALLQEQQALLERVAVVIDQKNQYD